MMQMKCACCDKTGFAMYRLNPGEDLWACYEHYKAYRAGLDVIVDKVEHQRKELKDGSSSS